MSVTTGVLSPRISSRIGSSSMMRAAQVLPAFRLSQSEQGH
ncbi:hypothetical protein J2T09_000559 [Neorhizobium huautlense]|uniref:Uncharacterized protein n=1 Tax=Neorhizobium huautlense TaxID=67774 RepID=A0ABT9PMX3_9HYPH|nr:hypothetical protein [Neorhizobium huautlense]